MIHGFRECITHLMGLDLYTVPSIKTPQYSYGEELAFYRNWMAEFFELNMVSVFTISKEEKGTFFVIVRDMETLFMYCILFRDGEPHHNPNNANLKKCIVINVLIPTPTRYPGMKNEIH